MPMMDDDQGFKGSRFFPVGNLMVELSEGRYICFAHYNKFYFIRLYHARNLRAQTDTPELICRPFHDYWTLQRSLRGMWWHFFWTHDCCPDMMTGGIQPAPSHSQWCRLNILLISLLWFFTQISHGAGLASRIALSQHVLTGLLLGPVGHFHIHVELFNTLITRRLRHAEAFIRRLGKRKHGGFFSKTVTGLLLPTKTSSSVLRLYCLQLALHYRFC